MRQLLVKIMVIFYNKFSKISTQKVIFFYFFLKFFFRNRNFYPEFFSITNIEF